MAKFPTAAEFRKVIPTLPIATIRGIVAAIEEIENITPPRNAGTVRALADFILDCEDSELITIMRHCDAEAIYRYSAGDAKRKTAATPRTAMKETSTVGKRCVVMFTQPRTSKRLFGIVLGGGRTLKIWEPSLGSHLRMWSVDWGDVTAYDLMLPGHGQQIVDAAFDYFEQRFKGDVDHGGPDYGEWMRARLKVGSRVEYTDFRGGYFPGVVEKLATDKLLVKSDQDKRVVTMAYRNVSNIFGK